MHASGSDPMSQITSYMIGGLAAVASWSMVAPPDAGSGIPSIAAAFQPADQTGQAHIAVNRAAKGDRLAPVRPSAQSTVATIEVVGVRDAAIIYRDRDGNVLYRTDPVSNVTVIAKGVKLPDLTVRQDAGSSATPIPIKVIEKTGDMSKMPIGCEPMVSPIASPRLSHLTGRCISEGERFVDVATAD
jgi:hypothetical protein